MGHKTCRMLGVTLCVSVKRSVVDAVCKQGVSTQQTTQHTAAPVFCNEQTLLADRTMEANNQDAGFTVMIRHC